MTETAPLPINGCGRGVRGESVQSQSWLAWLPVVAGVAILYLPAYRDLSNVSADTQGAAQIPVCLAIWIWLVWQKRAIFGIPDRAIPVSPRARRPTSGLDTWYAGAGLHPTLKD